MKKKHLSIMTIMAMAMVLAFSVQVFADCQVTLTAPGITKVGCERVGAVTFTFDADTVITEGDWWYMDLQSGTSICNDVNYVITGDGVANAGGTYNLADGSNAFFPDGVGGAAGLLTDTLGTGIGTGTIGPLSVTREGAAVNANVTITGVNAMVFQVMAAENSQRVWVKVFATDDDVELTVPTGHTFSIAVLDGKAYQEDIVLDRDGVTSGSDPDDIYGNTSETDVNKLDTIPADAHPTYPQPHIENTLCVDAEDMSGSDMYTSFDSLNNFITFTGDSKIAHMVGTNPITLENCKGVTEGEFAYTAQGACLFAYDDATGYCEDDAFATQSREWVPATDGGQRIFLQSASTFGDPGDLYKITLNIITPGVYFGASPGTLTGAESDDAICDSVGPGTAVGGTWTAENEAGDTVSSYPDSSCSVESDDRVREVYTATFTSVDTYKYLWIPINNFVYDSSLLGYGTEAELRVAVTKYPCGEIFTEDMTIGTYVQTCSAGGVAGSTLMFPFFPAMDGSMGSWWGGFAIVNGSTADGTMALTFTEATGTQATLSGVSVSAGQMYFTTTDATYLATLTAGSGFGDENCSLVAVSTFNTAAGFAFLGNLDEGTGYVAYTIDAGWD